MKARCIDIFSVGRVVSQMPMTCQINMLRERDRGRYVVVALALVPGALGADVFWYAQARDKRQLPNIHACLLTLAHSHKQTHAEDPRVITEWLYPRGRLNEASCPWQRRMIMSLVVRAGRAWIVGAAGRSNMIRPQVAR